MDYDKAVFAKRLEALRTKQRKSRIVVSELCGLPPDTIRRYERGEASPNVASLVAIANYFCVSIDYLIGRTNY
jgi:transcriptional regulator with XRE-family HTH domain